MNNKANKIKPLRVLRQQFIEAAYFKFVGQNIPGIGATREPMEQEVLQILEKVAKKLNKAELFVLSNLCYMDGED